MLDVLRGVNFKKNIKDWSLKTKYKMYDLN